MWYTLIDLKSECHTETRIFFGEELKEVAVQLSRICDEAMQFDLSEMSIEDIDDYYTEGYENYESLQEDVSKEQLSAFWFRCNDVSIKVFAVTESYDALKEKFEAYTQANKKLKGWQLVLDVTEDVRTLKRLDAELQTLGSADPSKLEFFCLEK